MDLLTQFDVASLLILRSVGLMAQEQAMKAYLVGGPVRDLILGHSTADLDIVIEGNGPQIARIFACAYDGTIVIYPAFKTATVTLKDGRYVDFASTRNESYAKPGAFPKVRPADINKDLLRRDFTINAIAVSIDPQGWNTVHDPYGGLKDLKAKKIRVLHDRSFIDDPTRILRAARFKERFGFEMEKHTLTLMEAALSHQAMDTITPQRYKKEYDKILKEERSLTMLRYLNDRGAIQGRVYVQDRKSK